jgi:Uma2 family endonuclease
MNSAVRISKRPQQAEPLQPAIPTFPVRRFTVEEYHRMVEAGVLRDGEPYELIHGWIVQKMVLNPPHNYAVNALMEMLWPFCGQLATLRIQQPITTDDSEPEPDVVLATGTRADYATRHPTPAEVHVLVEVADTTSKNDQTTKLELYAKARVQAYWIVNLIDRRVEMHTEPQGVNKPAYKLRTDYGPEDNVPLFIGGKQVGSIPVKELLP